jgi:hypothetical protein
VRNKVLAHSNADILLDILEQISCGLLPSANHVVAACLDLN